jgi:hypothetical protein
VTLEEIREKLTGMAAARGESNFVAFAVKLHHEVIANHAALLLFIDGEYKAFHYDAHEVLLDAVPENDWLILNIFGRIRPELVFAFENLCRTVKEEAQPAYGYFYDGSFFDGDGQYKSATGTPQIFTCVGICLNVLKGFIYNLDASDNANQLIQFEDWNNSTLHPRYLEKFTLVAPINFPDTPLELLLENLRRIRPSEFLTIPFFEEFPVSKASIDEVIEHVETVLRERFPEPQEEI